MAGEHGAGRESEHDARDLPGAQPAGEDPGCDERRGGGQGDGRGALGDTDRRRDDVRREDERDADGGERVRDRVADPRGAEDASEHPAGAGDQDDRADRTERVVERPLDGRPAPSASQTEGDGGDDDRDEQGHRRLAQHAQEHHPGRLGIHDPCRAQGFQAGVQEDQDQGEQQQEDHRAGAGRILDLLLVTGHPREDGVRDVDVEPACDDLAPQVAGDEPDREHHEQAEDHHVSEVRLEEVRGGDRPGVRGQEDVHHREGGGHRDADGEQVHPQTTPDGVDDRDHQHEARVHEDREADEERGDAEREGCPVLAEDGDHLLRQGAGAAGGLHERAEHGADGHEERDVPEGVREPGDEGLDDVPDGDAGRERGEEADQDEGQEGVHLEAHHQDQQQEHGGDGDADEAAGAEPALPAGLFHPRHRGSFLSVGRLQVGSVRGAPTPGGVTRCAIPR